MAATKETQIHLFRINLSKGSFPIEKATKLGNLAFRGGGGSSKNQKSPKFQLGIVKKSKKSPKCQRVSKTEK